MCGIAGYTTFYKDKAHVSSLEAMGNAIAHRGPDASDTYIEDKLALVHRRLAIIDLSDAGVQPMHSNDGRYVIIFNGEIYNYQEHRQQLEAEGYPFKTHTDTEVILALYDKYGTECLAHLNGMFAFALWDKTQEQLFIARDRMGKKPLYYHYINGDIFFASELKSLMAVNAFPKTIRQDAVYDFFAYQYVPDPKTIFEDVFKLPPGHFMVFSAQGMVKKKYWDVSFAEQGQESESEFTSLLNDTLLSCTKNRMVSDVPLGAFLSGGVDSSGVVALMSQVASEDDSNHITTCSIGFDDEKYNEVEFARAVANQYHTNHHEFTVHQNVKDNLKNITRYFDEPFADPSLVPTYFVSELAREQVTVAVAGDGGDEVFAGYEKYAVDHLENKLRDKFPSWLRRSIFPMLAKCCGLISATPFKRARSLFNSLSVSPDMGFYISNSFITDDQWQRLVRPEFRKKLGEYHPSKITLDAYQAADGPDHLSKILYTDMKTYLPGGILVKVDRMSMANSLEVRAPILDYEVVELAAKMPSDYKFKVSEENTSGEKKHILKKLFQPMLPNEILYRKKMGFSVPLAEWLRGELKEIAEDCLFSGRGGITHYFKPNAIRKMWDEHQSCKRDNSSPLWSMLMFQLWWDEYMEL